jgi:hypothetical protein
MESSGERLILYTRTGGRLPPRDRERLEIFQNGKFEMWRSVSAASSPISPVGIFRGQVPKNQFDHLEALARAAVQAGDLFIKPVPDASIDTIQLAEAQARLGRHDQPAGPWGELVEVLRQALGTLASQVWSALSLEVSPDGSSASLRHLGTDPLRLDLSKLQVRAVLWQQHRKEGDWRMAHRPAEMPGQMEVGPGWVLALPFEHGFEASPGQVIAAYVTLSLFDKRLPVMVSLEARSQISGSIQ